MKLLAIETATDACSVALQVGDDVLSDHRLAAQQHAQLVLPMIDDLMARAKLKPADLDAIAFGRGPGSFTGVRIAAAVTQGIALGADLGVVGLSSMQAIAQGCAREFEDTHLLVALDARMGEVYWGAYVQGNDGLMMPVVDEAVCLPSEVRMDQSIVGAQWRFAGAGAERYLVEILGGTGLEGAVDGVPSPSGEGGHHSPCLRLDRWPDARDLLVLAAPLVAAGQVRDAADALPVYLRDRVALTEVERAAGQVL